MIVNKIEQLTRKDIRKDDHRRQNTFSSVCRETEFNISLFDSKQFPKRFWTDDVCHAVIVVFMRKLEGPTSEWTSVDNHEERSVSVAMTSEAVATWGRGEGGGGVPLDRPSTRKILKDCKTLTKPKPAFSSPEDRFAACIVPGGVGACDGGTPAGVQRWKLRDEKGRGRCV